jgi:uncharacterized membrane protein YhaH (DUF805 family)
MIMNQQYRKLLNSRLFDGRLSRLGMVLGLLYYFILLSLALSITSGIYAALLSIIDSNFTRSELIIPTIVFVIIYYAFLIVSLASVLIRRSHDLNRRGHFAWSAIVFGWVYLLIAPGDQAKNKYGKVNESLNPLIIMGFSSPTISK